MPEERRYDVTVCRICDEQLFCIEDVAEHSTRHETSGLEKRIDTVPASKLKEQEERCERLAGALKIEEADRLGAKRAAIEKGLRCERLEEDLKRVQGLFVEADSRVGVYREAHHSSLASAERLEEAIKETFCDDPACSRCLHLRTALQHSPEDEGAAGR